MKKSIRYIIIGICVCVIALLIVSAVKNKNNPQNKPDDTKQSDSAPSDIVTGENTFAQSGIPLPEGKALLTERSFAQCMKDIDGDGADDRITCATLDDEYETAYICVQYADGKTPDASISLYNGYTHPELFVGLYGDFALIYVKGESQGSSGEQMVYPFILNNKGMITPAVNQKAEYLGENSVFDLPMFADTKIGETYAEGRVAVETDYAPTLYITIPKEVMNSKSYDADYGMRIESANCEMIVDADENEIICSFDCSVIDPDRNHIDEATPVTLHVTFSFDGEKFDVASWDYEISDGIEYSYEGDIPAPSPVPGSTTSPMGINDKYDDTLSIQSVDGKTVYVRADLDGDGGDERIEIETDDEYNSVLRVYSSDKSVFEVDGIYINAYIADLTADGRRALIVERNPEDGIAQIAVYFLKNGKMKQVRARFDDCYNDEVWAYIYEISHGEIVFTFRTDIMGTRFWKHTAYLYGNDLRLTDSDYKYPDNKSFTLKKSITAEDKDGNKVSLKKGEKLTPVSSDFSSYVWYRDESGRILMMNVSIKDGWQYYINGVLQDDLFEDIGYAG